jgi:hypothetical protein
MMVIPGEELENLNPMMKNKPKALRSVHDDDHHFMQLEYITEPLFLFGLGEELSIPTPARPSKRIPALYRVYEYSCPLQRNLWF